MIVSLICLTNGKVSQASPAAEEESIKADNEQTNVNRNLISVIRKKYAPDGHENSAYFEVNYYDIDEKDVNLASDNNLLEYIEYEKIIKKNKKINEDELIGEDQYIYEKKPLGI